MDETEYARVKAIADEIRNDPWATMLSHVWTEAWALGYEQALRDLDADAQERLHHVPASAVSDAAKRLLYRDSATRRRQYAFEALGVREQESAKLLLAFAETGQRLAKTGQRLTSLSTEP